MTKVKISAVSHPPLPEKKHKEADLSHVSHWRRSQIISLFSAGKDAAFVPQVVEPRFLAVQRSLGQRSDGASFYVR